MLFVVGVSVFCTIALRFVQFRLFWRSLLLVVKPQETSMPSHEMTPLQAFVNTLSSNLGNGSIAGMATAVYAGGPGAAIWVVVFGFLMMAIRFAEVYISTMYGSDGKSIGALGGPMRYLRELPAGNALAYAYTAFCLLFSLCIGNAMQANSIRVSLVATFHWSTVFIACVMTLLVLYVVFGGARRIVAVSDRIVPIKVIVFVCATAILLAYHWHAIPHALMLMIQGAFGMSALRGGLTGFSIKQAIQFGMARSIMATESGLGSAAILFGSTGSTLPMHSALMGMMSTFMSTAVCFVVALCIVVSGAWDNGMTSTALTIASFSTVFGVWGSVIVSFLSVSFGIGVLVSYAYIARCAWLYVSRGKGELIFSLLYALTAMGGVLLDVEAVWALGDIFMAGMLCINLLGILYLLPSLSNDKEL
jgi:alanine or glycine:cation symporter, AGCS family